MREKELRLALVCYGGVSLAIYMHGITKEIWKLLRASAGRANGVLPDSSADSEAVYSALLARVARHTELRVIVDILAGASAGGINSVLLAHAIVGGHSLEPLRGLWLNQADIDKLLDPGATRSRWKKWWAMPAIWWAIRRIDAGQMGDDHETRAEMRAKLSRFMRSRWFEPPFSGRIFSRYLYDALLKMEIAGTGEVLIPPTQPLDLFVTVTDYFGSPERLRIDSPPEIIETEHRVIIGFKSEAPNEECMRSLGHRAELAFAARATASFPGAFPPAQIGEIDSMLKARNETWPGVELFMARILPRRAHAGYPPETATLIDGSVLNNRPFGPAIEALRHRPAHREVDRRFVYIDPTPGVRGASAAVAGKPPGFLTTILKSVADIPRKQPIRDNLEALETLSRHVRRMRYVIDGMGPSVDAAIEASIGADFFMETLTAERLAAWRSRTQSVAAREAGFAYAAYGQLKFAQIVESLATRIVALGEFDMAGGAEDVREAVWEHVRAAGYADVAAATAAHGADSRFVGFLRSFDTEFRIRRLRLLVRRLNELVAALPEDALRPVVDAAKTATYSLLGPYIERRRDGFYSTRARMAAALVLEKPGAALDALRDDMDLRALDDATDAALLTLFGPQVPPPLREALMRTYLGFPFYDIAILPLLQTDRIDEFDEIKVDRISPADSTTLDARAEAVLRGTRLNSFGAFFCRAYRENDYLWGRLHGAERMIDIIASTLPEGEEIPEDELRAFKAAAFRAILNAERDVLTGIDTLIADLYRKVDAMAAAG